MKMINLNGIYIIWLREMKTFVRAKSRVVGMLMMPVLLLGFLGSGFGGAMLPGIPEGVGYLQYLVPGMVGLTMIFTSMFAGMSVLWDRQFGFLKEIMVTPVSRVSIVIGRILGGTTTAVIQGIGILVISLFLGFKASSAPGFIMSIAFMALISVAFIGMGLAIASKLKDMQGFGLIMNFLIFPLLFLSGAIFPVNNLPAPVNYLALLNPLTYGVDGMRASLIGVSSMPLVIDLLALFAFCVIMVFAGAYLFEKSESV